MSYILTSDIVFYSSLMAELRKHGFILHGRMQKWLESSIWKAVIDVSASNSGMDPCVPRGLALGLGLFNTSTNDLDDKTENMLIKSADYANRGRATHPLGNRPGIENDLTNESSSPKHQNAL